MNAQRNANRGFTLVEALIATSLLAMLGIMILAGMRTGFRVWDRSSAANTGAEEVAFAQEFLRRSIEGAYPRLKPNSAGAVDFAGIATNLEFSGPGVHAISLAGRVRLTFSVVSTESGEDLIVILRPEIAQESAVDTRETLFRAARDIRFSYLEAGSNEWIDEWRDRPVTPALVRIDVTLSDEDRRRWPTFVARPLIGADVDCRYDPLTRGCVGRRR